MTNYMQQSVQQQKSANSRERNGSNKEAKRNKTQTQTLLTHRLLLRLNNRSVHQQINKKREREESISPFSARASPPQCQVGKNGGAVTVGGGSSGLSSSRSPTVIGSLVIGPSTMEQHGNRRLIILLLRLVRRQAPNYPHGRLDRRLRYQITHRHHAHHRSQLPHQSGR